MTNDEKKKLYAALAAPFPEACIQRTSAGQTGRGYDTTGIGYQYVVNRLNEVLGVGGFRPHRTVTVKEFTRANGRAAYEAACDMTLELGAWENGQFVVFAESLADGGHVAASEADARKGAYTNAFKKAAAFFGVGRQAYEGSLDDDNLSTEAAPVSPVPVQAQQAQTPSGNTTSDVAVRRQPAAAPAAPPAEPTRNRVSSKQLGAVWAIARKAGLEQSSLRAQVKVQFGVQLEFLSRQQASELIDALSRKLSANGHAPTAAEAANGP
jgi:hypothetical protein